MINIKKLSFPDFMQLCQIIKIKIFQPSFIKMYAYPTLIMHI